MASLVATLPDRQRMVSSGHGDTGPLLKEELIHKNGADINHRRVTGKNGMRHRPARQRSFRKDIGHVASETYLVTRLSFTLLQYLGIGYRWMIKLLALGWYAMLLMPGFLQVAYYYFLSSRVKRSVVYGDQPRNRLDLYLPGDTEKPKPVLIFVTGGAWIIGYKAWGSFLGLQLAERGIIVACIDYRNFPQGTISDMVKDVSQGISFVFNNISCYGGDPNRIYLMGQSAGAHISSCALLDQAIRESGNKESISWSVSKIKAYFGLSGGYNLPILVDHFNNRGLYRSIFLSIMEGEESLHKFSPELKILDPSFKDAICLLPPIILFHGNADRSIPSDSSKRFADALEKVGLKTELILYDGKTHTDLFIHPFGFGSLLEFGGAIWKKATLYLIRSRVEPSRKEKGYLVLEESGVSHPWASPSQEDPLRGGKDDLFDHVVAMVHSDDREALAKDAVAPPRRRLVPEFLIKLAGGISPF